MAKSKGTVSVYVSQQKTVYIEEEVDVTIKDFVDGLSDDDAKELMKALALRVPEPAPTQSPLMERLYLAVTGARRDLLEVAREVLYEHGGRIA